MNNDKNVSWLFKYYLFNANRNQAKKLIEHSEFWTSNQIEEYQFNQLKKLLTYANYNVPYYSEIFKKVNFNPTNFKNIEEIKKIPLLTKSILREKVDLLISTSFPKKYIIKDASGGTTGIPVSFYADIRFFSPVEWVYIKSLWKRVGYSFYDKYVIFRGDIIDKKNIIENKKYWKYDPFRNCLIFSSFRMSDKVLPLYIEKLRKFSPKYIHAYPSVLYVLAEYFLKNNIRRIPSLKGILLSSETMYDWQRELFQKAFGVKIYSWYGHRERCTLAGEFGIPSVYEVFPTYGFTELINNNGNWCENESEPGEIVATSFNNYACPLIRYQTHDIAEYSKDKSSHTEYMRIKNIKGRIQDFFVDKNGSLISFSTSHRVTIPIKDKILAHQYVQDESGFLILKIEPKESIDTQELKIVEEEFNKRFPYFDLTIKIVDKIPRTRAGKFRYFIQNMNIEYSDYKSQIQ